MSLALGYLAAGYTPDQIIQEFPDLLQDQIAACLDYARDLSEFETVAEVSLRFFADQCIPNLIVQILRDAGYNVLFISNYLA